MASVPPLTTRVVPGYQRHPLGMPEGSVRALLAFMVLGIVWLMMLLPEDKIVPIPLYLYYLVFLILGHYFAARGHGPGGRVPGERPPLWLPKGTIRTLIVLGFAAVVGWGYYHDPRFLERLTPNPADVTRQPLLPVFLIGTFFVGTLVASYGRRLARRPEGVPPWFQDMIAWISLIAVLGLLAEYLIQLVINPTLPPEKQLNLPEWQGILACFVSFYYGARS